GKSFEEIVDELRLQVADALDGGLELDDRVRPAAEVNRRHCKRFVHRHHEVSRAIDPPAIAERLGDGLTERDAKVLDGVVVVDIQIAGRLDRQVECTMPREQFQHVVEKTNTGADGVCSLSVEPDRQGDLCFSRPAVDYGAAHMTSSSTLMNRRVCSTTPAAT